MTSRPPQAVAKTHPATREMMPADPLELTGFQVPGDPDLMLRLLVEEYARMGWDTASIMRLAEDPFYPGFHALLRLHGKEQLQQRIRAILARCGVTRVSSIEAGQQQQLVQLRPPRQSAMPDGHTRS